MKKILFSLMILMLMLMLMLSAPSFADAPDIKSVNSALQEIQTVQNVQDSEQIDPEKATPEQLEELGDAVMGELIGDSERHEWMDQMLGGEGSASLKSFHMDLGYRYLNGEPLTMHSMMMGNQGLRRGNYFKRSGGYGMMNGIGFGRGFGMMNGSWTGTGGMMMGLLILILAGGAVYLFTRKYGNQVSAGSGNTAMEILKMRYAKGEITHDEFEMMKTTLKK